MNARDDILAAGDVSGRILIWRNFADVLQAAAQGKAQQPPCTTLHLHPHAVGCLAFSPDSNYLLSGGQEATLVRSETCAQRRDMCCCTGCDVAGCCYPGFGTMPFSMALLHFLCAVITPSRVCNT